MEMRTARSPIIAADDLVSLGDILEIVGQLYAIILLGLAIGLAAIDPDIFPAAIDVMPLDSPALMANFTA
jgi:hypothetical protein